jgi:hypothetical protein
MEIESEHPIFQKGEENEFLMIKSFLMQRKCKFYVADANLFLFLFF